MIRCNEININNIVRYNQVIIESLTKTSLKKVRIKVDPALINSGVELSKVSSYEGYVLHEGAKSLNWMAKAGQEVVVQEKLIGQGALRMTYAFAPMKKAFIDSLKELLKIEYERLNEQTYHLEIIGFSFIIAGLTIVEKGALALFILGLGFFVLTIIALPSYGRSERRYRCFRDLIKK